MMSMRPIIKNSAMSMQAWLVARRMVFLYCLMEFKTVRFNELKRYLKNISDKTLRNRGKSLMRVLDQLCVWGENNSLVKQ